MLLYHYAQLAPSAGLWLRLLPGMHCTAAEFAAAGNRSSVFGSTLVTALLLPEDEMAVVN